MINSVILSINNTIKTFIYFIKAELFDSCYTIIVSQRGGNIVSSIVLRNDKIFANHHFNNKGL